MQNHHQQQDHSLQDNFTYSQLPEPEPDYHDDDDDDEDRGDDNGDDDFGDFPPPPSPLTLQSFPTIQLSDDNDNNNNSSSSSNSSNSSSNAEETTQARRVLPPGAMSKERAALHRELLMNHRAGRAVPQKGELSRVLSERKASQRRQEWQQQQSVRRTSLELKLEQRAQRLEQSQEDRMQGITEGEVTSELAQIHRRITQKGATHSPSPT